MRIFLGRNCLAEIGMLMLLSFGVCGAGRADDDPKPSRASATSAAKPPSTNREESGLTEREQLLLDEVQLLLDNVEQLKKRVGELEAKEHAGNSGAAPASTNATKEVATSERAGIPAVALGTAKAGFTSSSGNSEPGGVASVQTKQEPPAAGAAASNAATNEPKKPIDPFSDADWTWLNGNPRTKEIYWDTKFFTPEIRADTNYVANFNHPTDHTIGGSSELFRSYEVQLEQFGVGGDFHYDNVRARFMTQFGMYSATTPRNDPSPGHGQWDLPTAYRYSVGSIWRISLQRAARHQCRRGNLHVLHRLVQLLQFRQLGLPTILCFLQHSLVL